MATAKYSIMSVEIHCPQCEGEVFDPTGSTFWEVNQIESGKDATCENGHTFKLPKIPTRAMKASQRQGEKR